MDTDDLSREAYKAVITEADKFNHNLALPFGVLASDCDNENEYLRRSRELIKQLRTREPEELKDIFFGEMPDITKLNLVLDKIVNNIERVQRLPISKRKYDF